MDYTDITVRHDNHVAYITINRPDVTPNKVAIIERGDVISVQLPNWWQFNALVLACARVGAAINPIMPILRQRELRFILERVEAKVCIVPDSFKGFEYAAAIMSLRSELPHLEHVVALGAATPTGTIDFDTHFLGTEWEAQYPPESILDRAAHPNDVAQIMFTSGTTGEPKGVLHTHNTLDASMRAVPLMCEIQSDDVVIMPSPTAHQAGYMYGMIMPAVMGITVALQDTWNPQ